MTLACACGNPDWFACEPGTASEPPDPADNVLLLRVVPDVPMRVWCLQCWPWRKARARRSKR